MITETRQIAFSDEALMKAIALYAAGFPEKMPQGRLLKVQFRSIEPPTLTVVVEADGRTTEREVEFSRTEIAALLMHYCRRERIPLPRVSEKGLMVDKGRICLVITKTLAPPPAEGDAQAPATA